MISYGELCDQIRHLYTTMQPLVSMYYCGDLWLLSLQAGTNIGQLYILNILASICLIYILIYNCHISFTKFRIYKIVCQDHILQCNIQNLPNLHMFSPCKTTYIFVTHICNFPFTFINLAYSMSYSDYTIEYTIIVNDFVY